MCQLKDLKRKILNAKLSKVKSADGGEDARLLKLPKSKAYYKLQRVCKTTGVWSDGHVEMVHTKAMDTWLVVTCCNWFSSIGCSKAKVCYLVPVHIFWGGILFLELKARATRHPHRISSIVS